MADIIRAMDCYLTIDFMDVSSYGDAFRSSGEVKIVKTDTRVEGKDILIVEDIIDTGQTLKYVWTCSTLSRKANSVKGMPCWARRDAVITIWKQLCGLRYPQ